MPNGRPISVGYTVGDITYPEIAQKRDFILQTVKDNGLVIDTEDHLRLSDLDYGTNSKLQGLIFIAAHKHS